ncbi:hypothetical protein C7271_14030 [filamentous cyanobacterium CCP5]|nr:hypothetical protein C7271_14030 [filamentous cyanobacterium CCP5]
MSNPVVRFFKDLFVSKQDWWVEIKTSVPQCTYYFGPFNSEVEAAGAKFGYIEDLQQEGAQNISSTVMQCSAPPQLTIADDADEFRGGIPSAAFSS